VIDALATDISAGRTGSLTRDIRRAEGLGMPPDPKQAALWTHILERLRAVTAELPGDPARAQAEADIAAMELTGLGST
jgi:hypothetical protein